MRRRREVVETYSFSDGEIATTITRSPGIGRLYSHLETTRGTEGAVFRHGAVPTKRGWVYVWSWANATQFSLILDGSTYERRDEYGAPSLRALYAAAGKFAARCVELHGGRA